MPRDIVGRVCIRVGTARDWGVRERACLAARFAFSNAPKKEFLSKIFEPSFFFFFNLDSAPLEQISLQKTETETETDIKLH